MTAAREIFVGPDGLVRVHLAIECGSMDAQTNCDEPLELAEWLVLQASMDDEHRHMFITYKNNIRLEITGCFEDDDPASVVGLQVFIGPSFGYDMEREWIGARFWMTEAEINDLARRIREANPK
jgi:hypothetical protein